MNAVEIGQATTDLAERPFESARFAYAILEVFGNTETTFKTLSCFALTTMDRVSGDLE